MPLFLAFLVVLALLVLSIGQFVLLHQTLVLFLFLLVEVLEFDELVAQFPQF